MFCYSRFCEILISDLVVSSSWLWRFFYAPLFPHIPGGGGEGREINGRSQRPPATERDDLKLWHNSKLPPFIQKKINANELPLKKNPLDASAYFTFPVWGRHNLNSDIVSFFLSFLPAAPHAVYMCAIVCANADGPAWGNRNLRAPRGRICLELFCLGLYAMALLVLVLVVVNSIVNTLLMNQTTKRRPEVL